MPLSLPAGVRIVAATHNPGKARELAVLLDGRYQVVTAGELGLAEPDETDSTFTGNALIKARAAADASGLIALADDSGLSVTALEGAPGVHSARWAGPAKDFALAMAKVEERLVERATDDRSAWFTCALAVAWPKGPAVVVEGQVHGRLAFPGRGTRGFGYDPIFVPDGCDQTFGEMEPAAKDAISHRARAFDMLKAALFLIPPLGVYVHWPYCARICPYCDFNVRRDRGQGAEQAALAAAIVTDLERHAAILGPRRLVSIYLGGGTPSLMKPEWAGEIIAAARRLWPGDAEPEVTLEANPTDAEASRFEAFRDAGAQRLSLGVQALDDASLAFLGRNHSAGEAIGAARTAARIFPRLSLDLIYARPGQTVEAWRDELGRAIDLGAEHISPYQLTIEAGTAFDRAVRRGAFAPAEEGHGADLFEATQDVLTGHGFQAYEVSNHARGPAARSRHNLVYWRGQDYVGVGPGAHGRLTLADGRAATHSAPRVEDYVRRVAETGTGWLSCETLTPLQAAEERLLMGLRTHEGVTLDDLAPVGITASSPHLADLAEAGLLDVETGRVTATPRGRMVLDRLVSDLATHAGL